MGGASGKPRVAPGHHLAWGRYYACCGHSPFLPRSYLPRTHVTHHADSFTGGQRVVVPGTPRCADGTSPGQRAPEITSLGRSARSGIPWMGDRDASPSQLLAVRPISHGTLTVHRGCEHADILARAAALNDCHQVAHEMAISFFRSCWQRWAVRNPPPQQQPVAIGRGLVRQLTRASSAGKRKLSLE
jgi:hypothetical protein